ncbi:heterogeneous nuclear ribonucleoprotein U-like protein 2 [Trichomycterus rosablanca]|uniref:heterogeneous nuclear ribonucleoprotein U-like protein 2 n=1 Tax=Trichomycterus rosablanca TaxID=2290929 RepID=UPI002F351608
MLLEEVKRLKVTELRTELKERGLDPRGLKAELVARLISAIERTESDQLEELNSLNTKAVSATEEQDTELNQLTCLAASLPTGDNVTAPTTTTAAEDHHSPVKKHTGSVQIPTISQSHVDQSTQTESDLSVTVSHPPCSCSRREVETHQFTTQSLPSSVSTSTDVHVQSAQCAQSASPTPVPTLPVSEPEPSSHINDQSMPSTMKEMETENQDKHRELRRPLGERGRDYYEFKEEIQYKRAKTPEPGPVSEDEMDIDEDMIRLDPYNSDMHFEVGSNGSSGQPLLWEKFPLLRSGCRLTHGFTQGKVGFEVKFVKRLSLTPVDGNSIVDPEPHVLRVGWSVDGSSFQLGEDKLSFGFDVAGRAVTNRKMEEFGEPFSEGDVIGCYAFISEAGQAELSFSKNGHHLGVAFHLDDYMLAGRALYPHVLCKNCSVSLNLDPGGTAWHPGPSGYCPFPALPSTQLTRASLSPSHRKDCEMLMMVGMPGSGKSHWTQSHMATNPEKHYNVLSTDSVLHCMNLQLPNPEHKELLLQQATQCLTHIIKIAATKRRNFILDQANIYPSARRHKLLRFAGYQRRAIVVVPSDKEWKRRLQQQEQNEGAVPEMSLLKSKASFTLPEQGDLLEEVLFVELCREEAQSLLKNYKEEAGRVLPAPSKRKKLHNKPNKAQNPHGWTMNRNVYAQQSQWGRQKPYGRPLSAFPQSYGYNSDPQQYRDYYQPCTTQWNAYDQNQSYYSNQNYYFGNQASW